MEMKEVIKMIFIIGKMSNFSQFSIFRSSESGIYSPSQ